MLPVLHLLLLLAGPVTSRAPFTASFTGAGKLALSGLECDARNLAFSFGKGLVPLELQETVFEALELRTRCGRNYIRSQVEVERKLQNGEHGCEVVEVPLGMAIQDALVKLRKSAASCKRVELAPGIHSLEKPLEIGAEDANTEIVGEASTWISGGKRIEINLGAPETRLQGKNGTTMINVFLRDINEIPSLFGVEPHVRFQRARWPNGNTERDQWGYASPLSGWVSIHASKVKNWTKPIPSTPPDFFFVDLRHDDNPTGFVKNDSMMRQYNMYSSGKGGVCDEMWDTSDGGSYWCGNASAGGWAEVDQRCAKLGRLELPVGIEFFPDSALSRKVASWKNVTAGPAIIHAWHSQSWFTNMWSVGHHDKAKNKLTFDKGGSQGGRSWCACNECGYAGSWCRKEEHDERLISGTWYIENVLEELDQPGEFFFDKHAHVLKMIVNSSSLEGRHTLELVVPIHSNLISVKNAANITLRNLSFRDTKFTFLEKHGVPSGGDWSFFKEAAVFLEDTKNVKIVDCKFKRLDGNGVLLYGRNRNTKIEGSEFAWLGESAMAAWGRTNEWDGRNGDQPRGTTIKNNVVREIGIYEKQSSAWFQAKACQTTISGNVFFNMPRAAINFNDGFGGGNAVRDNLIFNTCRESGDHGNINTWDRMPFLWDETGDFGFDTPETVIERNLIFANYGASQSVDNDDGSSFYNISNNVMFQSEGFKMDYGGHDSTFTDNYVVVFPYDGQNCFNVANFKTGHQHRFIRNTCIITGCSGSRCPEVVGTMFPGCEDAERRLILANNTYHTLLGKASIRCGNSPPVQLTVLQEKLRDFEPGSRAASLPSSDEIISEMKSRIHSWRCSPSP